MRPLRRTFGASLETWQARFWTLAFASLLVLSCAPLPKGRYTLDGLTISGDHHVDDEDIEGVIASRENTRFLGLFSGIIYDYEVFDRYVLERDLVRIERYYRARGYYSARVRAARVVAKGRKVYVNIRIEEGPPVVVRRVDLHGLQALERPTVERLQSAVQSELRVDRPFEEAAFARARDELSHRLADQGYAYAAVRRAAEVDLPRNVVAVGFWVSLGPKAEFGEVRIEGLGPFPEAPVRRALDIRPGTPYSQSELDEAKRALLDLGVFSAVSIEPEVDLRKGGPRPTRVPIRVRVERAKLRSVHLGGGVQADALKTDVHLIAGWEDSNFFGGFRKLMIEAVPGVVIYPTRLPSFETPERLLPQAKLRTEFRQPGLVEARTNAVVRAQASIYPVLLSGDRDPALPILGYRDVRTSVGLERSLWKFYGALSQNVQVSSPFTYLGALDADLGTILVSYPELFATFDLRNDRMTPHKGVYVAMDAQFAGLGGDVRDVKLEPDARVYVPLARRWTLAARTSIGLLFPRNYGQTIERNANTGDFGVRATSVRDIQIMFLRSFFSGGAGSNRGYAPREIGPHGVVPFYNPGQSPIAQRADCAPNSPTYSSAVCDLPLGGFTLWEANLELRFPLLGPLTGAAFSDASDVSASQIDFRLDRPHFSVGFGFRYETPVGPVRVDVGYRVPGLQAPAGAPDEGTPSRIFGLPLAASFGIGEPF
jgi:outer membrane protein insertion porin family/translocation and assembly module TamA